MTVYTAISKSLGLQARELAWPRMEDAKSLLERVLFDKSAFYQVFEYHRFLPSGTCLEEWEVQDVLHEAFLKGSEYWKTIKAG